MPFTQDSQDLLRILATKATTQETVVTDTSATSRILRQENRMVQTSNQMVWFPRKQQQLWLTGMRKKH
jgi:hypothetical protein